jgi:inosine/xanthosine triphosphatase
MKVAVGGTFNILHRGHRALLDQAFEVGDIVLVGITSDLFASKGREDVLPLDERMETLVRYLESKQGRYELMVIDDPIGPAGSDPDIEAIVVSLETVKGAERVNEERSRRGLAPLEVISIELVKAEDDRRISSSRIVNGTIDREGHLRRLRIGVGSTNPVKIRAVEEVMRRIHRTVDVVPIGHQPAAGKQPWGLDTFRGARERAFAALGDNDLGVGIEAGVFERYDGLYDVQHCVVVDRDGRVTIGHGSGFRYPPDIAEKVRQGMTVGEAFDQTFDEDGLGRREGAIGLLTNSLLTRQQLTEQAVMAAMVPRIRPDLYH